MRVAIEINPAEPSPWLWTVLAAVFLLLAVVIPVCLGWWRRRRRTRLTGVRGEGIEPVRRDYLRLLDQLRDSWRAGAVGDSEALRQASRLLRQFAGLVADPNTGSRTLDELRVRAMVRPELVEVVEVVEVGYQDRFAGRTLVPADVSAALDQARDVVVRWV